jgi:O-antigen/teichoic acid export membrane protein
LVVVFIIFGQNILEFVYGMEYSEAYWPLAVIVTGFVIVNLVGPSMLLLHATNYENDALVISMAGAGLTILLCVTLIPAKGALGAALAITISKVARALAFRIWAQFRINQYFQEK